MRHRRSGGTGKWHWLCLGWTSRRILIVALFAMLGVLAWTAAASATELPVNTAAPTTAGTPTEGEALSVTTGSWTGTEPISYAYQWQRCNLSAVGSRGWGAGQFSAAEGIAVDSHGNIWVSDTYNHRLVEFNEKREYIRTVGSRGTGPGQLEEPEGVAINSKGDVLVTDWKNDRVEEYSETGEYMRQFGTKGSGLGQLVNPYGIAVDQEDEVLVADMGNNRVEKFSETGVYVSTLGSEGSGPGQFSEPAGIAVDTSTDFFAVDSGNSRLEKFTGGYEYLTSLGSEGSGDGQFRYPEDVATDTSGHIWVLDTGNNRLEEFNNEGEYLRQAGAEGSGVGELGYSPALAIDTSDDVWVMDSGNKRVEEFNQEGYYVHNETCADIGGATGSAYSLTSADVGSEVRVVVTAANIAGEASATGYSSATVGGEEKEPEPPTSVIAPSIEGTSQDGQTLTSETGTWSGPEPISYAYQWQECDSSGEHCANISGATSSTYTLGHGNVGDTLRVIVKASNVAGSASSTSEASAVVSPLAPANATAPVITGIAEEGGTLSAHAGTWIGTPPLSYAYKWQRCDSAGESCTDISGAIGSSYVLAAGDIGSTLRVKVSATNVAGSASDTSAATAIVAYRHPRNLALPTISGIARAGLTLTARTGAWESVPSLSYTYQWQRCEEPGKNCSDISGATSSTYILSPSDVASAPRVVVTATNSAGSTSSDSEPAAVVEALVPSNTTIPVISGTAEEGQALTASAGSWEGTPPIAYAYQWQSCDSLGEGCLDVAGATSPTYTLRASDVGITLRALVTAMNVGGSVSAHSSASAVVTTITSSPSGPSGAINPLPYASGTVVVSGLGVSSGFGFGGATIEVTPAGESSWSSICSSITPSLAGDFKCSWSTASETYPDGLYQLRAQLTDESSPPKTAATNPIEVLVDNTPPNGSVTERSYLRGRETVSGTAGDSGSGVASWQLQINDGGSGWTSACPAQASPASGETYSCPVSSTKFADGSHSLRALITDKAGNTYVTPAVNTTIDNTPPAGAFEDLAEPEDVKGALTLQGIAEDQGSGVASWTPQIAGPRGGPWTDVCAPQSTPTSGSTYGCTWDTTGTTDGSYRLRAQVLDTAGNTFTTNIQAVTIDNHGGSVEPEGAGSDCTIFWTGDGGDGSWLTGTNWSTGKVPAGNDRACIPAGLTAELSSGAVEVAATGGSGAIKLDGGSLVLVDGRSQSAIGSLIIESGALMGAGSLDVASSFTWSGGAILDSGTTVLGPDASSAIDAGLEGVVSLDRGTLVNEGTLTWSEGAIELEGDAEIENSGTIHANSESMGVLGGAIVNADGSSPWIYNTGTITKTEGSGETRLAVAVDNGGSVAAESGELALSGGGEPGQTSAGSWAAGSGASIAFAAGAFSLGSEVQMSGAIDMAGAAVTAGQIDGYEANLSLSGGSLTLTETSFDSAVHDFSETAGTLAGAGWLDVVEAFAWSGGRMTGPGGTSINGSGQVAPGYGGLVALDKRTLFNSGTLTWENGVMDMEGNSRIVNYGAFYANAENPSVSLFGIIDGDVSSPSIENLGSVEKTAGEGVTPVRVPFDNQGVVKSNTGRLEFSGGGDTGVVAEGSWGTEASGSIALTDGSFLIAPAVDLGDVLVEGATVITDTTPPTGSLTVPARMAGLSEITGATEDGGSGVASWQLEISPEGEESWQEACSVETLPLGSSLYGCTFDTTSYSDGVYRLRALIVDHAGNTYTTSAVSTEINNAPLNVALPTASGNAAEGQVLSAGVGSWAGIEPISYAYQWESCNTEGAECSTIEGATHHTYTPGAGVVGSTLRVTVSASNTDGSASAASSPTSVITTGLANTTAPSISGTAEDGQMLTAEPGSWTGPEPISYTYQWQSCNVAGGECEAIEGASDSTYVLNDLNVAHTIRVLVTASNSSASTIAGSAVTEQVTVAAPSELEAPSVFGNPNLGEVLYADQGAWGGTEPLFSYQWQRCDEHGGACADIESATEPEYTVVSGDVGSTIRVVVTAVNEAGTKAATSAATPVVRAAFTLTNSSPPSISGSPQSEATLTVNDGTWSGSGSIIYSYQWQACDEYGSGCEDIEGATGSSYTTSEGDIGNAVRVVVSATDENGTLTEASQATQPITAAVTPLVSVSPLVSGADREGQTLTVNTGTWSGIQPIGYDYQWVRCDEEGAVCADIEGATAASHTVTKDDVGSTLRVLVTATSRDGSAVGVSAPTSMIDPASLENTTTPAISGIDHVGRTLKASPGIWNGTRPISYVYRWQRCDASGGQCSNISGATLPSYRLQEADAGHTVRVEVTASGAWGTATAISDLTSTITSESTEARPEDATLPTITGGANVSATLEAHRGSWTGSSPINYSYQWESCSEEGTECVAIEGATTATYVPGEGKAGKTLRVTVTASNAAGTTSVTSGLTEAIGVSGSLESTGAPAISGTAIDKHQLSASNGKWSGSRPIIYAYQWERCDAEGSSCAGIESATHQTYTAQTPDIGGTLRVEITATNASGSVKATSAPTALITTSPPTGQTPVITGSTFRGETLTASDATAIGTEPIETAYQWRRCNEKGEACSDIEGATSATYTSEAEDVGFALKVVVTYTNGYGSDAKTSQPSTAILDVKPSYVSGFGVELPSTAPLIPGEVLTVNAGTWQGSAPLTYSYHWQRCGSELYTCENISGATEADYTLTESDEHKNIRVVLKATNDAGSASVTSTTYPVESLAGPVNMPGSAPTITGQAIEGKTLTAHTGSWWYEPTEYKYKWELCSKIDIEGGPPYFCGPPVGTGTTLELTPEDTEHAGLVLGVTAVNAHGSTTAWSTPTQKIQKLGAINVEVPTIAGEAIVEATLEANAGAWEENLTPYQFQWQLCNSEGNACQDIAGATSTSSTHSTYVPPATDVGHTIRVAVIAKRNETTVTTTAMSAATPVMEAGTAPVNAGAPYIEGSSATGEIMNVSLGVWEGTPIVHYRIEWQRCNVEGTSCIPLHDSTEQYVPHTADIGHTLRATVTGWNAAGEESTQTEPSEEIIAGEAPVNLVPPEIEWPAEMVAPSNVELRPGSWQGGPTLSDQMERCDPTKIDPETEEPECTAIPYAVVTNNALAWDPPDYTAEASSVGYELRVAEIATNDQGSVTVYSTMSPVVESRKVVDTEGAYAGVLAVGGMITAESTVASEPELPISTTYEFLRVTGETRTTLQIGTSPSYTLVSGDAGHKIEIVMTATVLRDDEVVTIATREVSLLTPNVAEAPTNETPPTITGGTVTGEPQTAHVGTWKGGGGTLQYSYQWERCNSEGSSCADIPGATNQTYTGEPGDEGHTLRVHVIAANGGSTGSATSEPTSTLSEATVLKLVSPPTITGESRSLQTLTASPGSWLGSEPIHYSYQWESCDLEGISCFPLLGATGTTYRLGTSDIGSTLKVQVTAGNGAGTSVAASSVTSTVSPALAPVNTGPPKLTLFGPPAPGEIIEARGATWENVDTSVDAGELSYQWQRCEVGGLGCKDVPNADGSTYDVTSDDSGYRVRAVVIAENETGRASSASELSATIGEAQRRAGGGESKEEGEGGEDESGEESGGGEGGEGEGLGNEQLVYTSGHYLYTANPDGSEPKQLADCVTLDTSEEPGRCTFGHPSISPSGEMIAVELNIGASPGFCTGREICEATSTDLNKIVVMNYDGSEAHVLPTRGSEPVWGPREGSLTFARIVENKSDIESSTLYTTNIAEPEEAPESIELGPGLIREPAYSPDGSQLAYVVLLPEQDQELYVANGEGAEATRIPVQVGNPSQPAFTQDGKRLLFVAEPRVHRREGIWLPSVYEVGVDGSGFTRVTKESTEEEYIEHPHPVSGNKVIAVQGGASVLFSFPGVSITRHPPHLTDIAIEGGASTTLQPVPGENEITGITVAAAGPRAHAAFRQVCPKSKGVCGTWEHFSTELAYLYAQRYHLKSNREFYEYGNDCADYVSQLLLAGDMKMLRAYQFGTDSWWTYANPDFLGAPPLHSTSWSVADTLYRQLQNTGVARPLKRGETPHAGDIVFFDWFPSKGRINHVGMIVAGNNHNPTTEIYTSHTANRLLSMAAEYKEIGKYLHEVDPKISASEDARGAHWEWYILRPIHLSAYVP